MIDLLRLSVRSLAARKGPILLSLMAIALSVGLLVSTEKVREGVRAGFASTITGTDLIVGARTGDLSLVLYSVFRLGDPLQSVSWETFERVANHRDVAWVVPLSLGDSHQGYRVLGTDDRYLQHYQYGEKQLLSVATGSWLKRPRDTVLGAEVAAALGYQIGDSIVLSHGIVSASFANHDESPFTVAGILAPTGTPVDRTVHVSLAGLEALHGNDPTDENFQPQAITAFLVGMKSRPIVLRFQRQLNTYRSEPLTAVIPGVALSRLWSILAPVEVLLAVFTFLVFLVGMIGLSTTLLASLAGRRREMSVLRAVGARPLDLLSLLTVETVLTSIGGVLVGMLMAYGALFAFAPWLRSSFGLVLGELGPGPFDAMVLAAVVTVSTVAGLIPGLAAYRDGLNEDLTSGG